MIEIELPCCESVIRVDELTDEVRCEACGVVLELGDPVPGSTALPVAA